MSTWSGLILHHILYRIKKVQIDGGEWRPPIDTTYTHLIHSPLLWIVPCLRQLILPPFYSDVDTETESFYTGVICFSMSQIGDGKEALLFLCSCRFRNGLSWAHEMDRWVGDGQ